MRAELERSGRMLGNMDLLIAAHAASVGAVLVTNDNAFKNLEGLKEAHTRPRTGRQTSTEMKAKKAMKLRRERIEQERDSPLDRDQARIEALLGHRRCVSLYSSLLKSAAHHRNS